MVLILDILVIFFGIVGKGLKVFLFFSIVSLFRRVPIEVFLLFSEFLELFFQFLLLLLEKVLMFLVLFFILFMESSLFLRNGPTFLFLCLRWVFLVVSAEVFGLFGRGQFGSGPRGRISQSGHLRLFSEIGFALRLHVSVIGRQIVGVF